jgi:exonuclease VII small subunit
MRREVSSERSDIDERSIEERSQMAQSRQAGAGAGHAGAGADQAGATASVQRVDELIERLERAAEQLRSGELSADAAATLVEDCAALAAQASAKLERLARSEAPQSTPGQESLL